MIWITSVYLGGAGVALVRRLLELPNLKETRYTYICTHVQITWWASKMSESRSNLCAHIYAHTYIHLIRHHIIANMCNWFKCKGCIFKSFRLMIYFLRYYRQANIYVLMYLRAILYIIQYTSLNCTTNYIIIDEEWINRAIPDTHQTLGQSSRSSLLNLEECRFEQETGLNQANWHNHMGKDPT